MSPKPTEVIPSNTVPPLAYTVHEVAQALRVSARTVRNLLREGQLVRRKIGARTVVPVSSVEAFLQRDHSTGEEGKRRRKRGAR